MSAQLIVGLILTFLPVFELRAGLPIVINYAIKNSLPIAPFFILVLIVNILSIFAALLFFDLAHSSLNFYKKSMNKFLEKSKKKAEKLEAKIKNMGYLALMFFVAIPLPGTGAWTGSLMAWMLGLNRKKSILAISGGVIIAGTIVLLLSLGFIAL